VRLELEDINKAKPLNSDMNDYDYDVVIVGAGPVGGYLSRRLTEKGITVLILEEHAEIGRPFQCAGLINPKAMNLVQLENTVLTPIWGARIYSPEGTLVEIGQEDKIRTWSVCRKLFDEAVVMQGIESGAELWVSSKPIKLEITNEAVELEIRTPEGTKNVRSKMICGADGAHSWVRRTLRLGHPKETMIGMQIEVTGYQGVEGKLDMYTGSNISPGFFAWAIPSGETTRIGVWSQTKYIGDESCEDLLIKLMKTGKWNHRFKDCKEVGRFVGSVPSGILKKTTSRRAALFGDAAGICKPTTGGGIGPGFSHIDLIIEDLVESINKNVLDSKELKIIDKKLDKMRKSQNRARGLRDAFLSQSDDKELEEIFKIWAKPEVISMINEVGEIENPIPLGTKMLKEIPEFRKLAGKAIRSVLWS
jgi:digeranylgeranylglycerophospholipid reductase